MKSDSLVSIVFILSLIPIILLVAKFLKWLSVYIYHLRHYNSMPHRQIIPFIGNLHQASLARTGLTKGCYEGSMANKDRQYFLVWVATLPYICFHRCDHLNELFRNTNLSEKSIDYTFLHPWLKTGLLTSSGEKWSNRRKLITPSFHFDILKDFLLVINEQCDIFIAKLKNEVKKEKVALKEHIFACALDIICETAMGQHMNTQMNVDSEYIKAVQEMCIIFMHRARSPWLWPDVLFNRSPTGKRQKKCLNILHGFTKKIIKERDENFQGLAHCKNNRIAFLDMLLDAKHENPESISNEDIQEEVDTFMVAGHDTSATTINWALYNIARHPDVQKKIQQEIDDVMGNTNRHLTFEDLNKLEYLECVIKESLRLLPTIPFIGRYLKEDIVINGQKFLKGTTIMVIIFMLHRDEKYYPQPERFDPDRFKPENSANRPAFAYIPFSAGRRNCIGQKFAMMEMKVILANLLKNFEIKCDQSIEEIEYCFEIVLTAVNDIFFSLHSRYTV